MQLAQIWQRSRQQGTKGGSGTNISSGRSYMLSGWGHRANRGGGRSHRMTGRSLKEDIPSPDDRRPVVIGGSILDLTAKIRSKKIMVSMTNMFFYDLIHCLYNIYLVS